MVTPRRLSLVLALASVLAGCQQARPAASPASGLLLFERALVTREHVEAAAAVEAELAPRYRVFAPEGEPWFRALPGISRVLVVAGHATAQTRQGEMKPEDGGTGSLAVALNTLAGTPAIYTTYRSPSDPNFYDDNDFKRTLARMIERQAPAIVLDLHASHFSRPYDVDFGTMGGTSLLGAPHLLPLLARNLRNEGLANFSQDFFPAAWNETVTRWAARLGVPAVQCEINHTWLLSPREAEPIRNQRFAQLLQGLVRFVRAVDGRGAGASYPSPKLSAASPAMGRPIASEAAAAGDGASRT